MFAYAVYQLGAFLAQRFSLPTARKTAAAVGRLSCMFQRRNRRHLYRNLAGAFGDEYSPSELRRLRLKIYENFGNFVLDFLRLPDITRENIGEILTEESFERIRHLGELPKQGTPIISFTAHVGHWELGAAAVGLLGHRLTVLADEHPSPLVTRFFDTRRRDKGVKVVPVTAFHRCFRALRRQEVVAIVGDRPVTQQGVYATFFGKPALVPDGHAVLARRLGATIVPTYCVMNSEGLYDFTLGEPIVPPMTDDEDADVREIVDRCLRSVESSVRKYREQWYVFRPIWEPPGAGRRDRIQARRDRLKAREARLRAREERRRERQKRVEARG
jgi:KDO2-lipid IV(A) lauroyltransferase